MKSFAFAAIAAAANALTSAEFEYMNYVARFNKVHSDVEEFSLRAARFAFVDKFINEHNASGDTHVAGHNQFSDWYATEYKSILGYVRGESDVRSPVWLDEGANADSVNWVTKGAVTPVKDQGQCGSCWAFSSTGSLEGAHFVATGQLLSFSEQQLVDCAGIRYGNMACNGGLQDNAYKYYEAGHNAYAESDYPYTSGTTKKASSCKYSAGDAGMTTVTNYTHVTESNKDQMKAGLNKAPLAVAIEADKMVFQTYKSGVLTSSKCGTTLDHAVLAVGYGTENGQDYWLVKNSWNTTWGDKGYIKLGMNDSAGVCGVQLDPEYPTSN